MLKDPFDFKKKRNFKEAIVFGLFYIGCFAIISSVLESVTL